MNRAWKDSAECSATALHGGQRAHRHCLLSFKLAENTGRRRRFLSSFKKEIRPCKHCAFQKLKKIKDLIKNKKDYLTVTNHYRSAWVKASTKC